MGQRYEKGAGVKKSSTKAIAQYKKAAAQNHQYACERLADMYEKGEFVRKDSVLAAKYRAMSQGGDGELAAAQASEALKKSREDEIETALDYIHGRNGKQKDPQTGIRILFQAAKNKPIAQKVFVERWCEGAFSDATKMLSNDEYLEIIPWFERAWNGGDKRTGKFLGLNAYIDKKYSSALGYWQGCGSAYCWYFVGRFYDPISKTDEGGGPENMRDKTKARRAYEKCLRIDNSYDDARLALGLIYLFSKNEANENLLGAKNIFAYFLKKYPDSKWYNYDYGLAGLFLADTQFHKKWSGQMVANLFACKEQADANGYMDLGIEKEYNRMIVAYNAFKRAETEYLPYIQKAAKLGCKPAQEFLNKNYNDDQE